MVKLRVSQVRFIWFSILPFNVRRIKQFGPNAEAEVMLLEKVG